MRCFFICFIICFSASASVAEVRDLFAEFEAETLSSTAQVSSSSSVGFFASSAGLSSSSFPGISSSSIHQISSSSVITSSSGVALSSSSVILSSSSAISSALLSSSSLAELKSIPESSSSSVFPVSSSSSAVRVVADLSSSSMSRRELLGPVKVSKVRGIDEMKGRYKSPRKALFMSLLIPGSGQIYVGGSTFNYVRGATYLAIEAGLWGGWYYYSVYKYDKQVSKYKKFAKAHYSASEYENAMHTLYGQTGDTDAETNFNTRYMSDRESYCKAIYGTATTAGCYTKDELFTNDAIHLSNASEIGSSRSLYDEGTYYSLISGSTYVLGWDDVENETAISALNLNDADAETVALGTSQNLQIYRSIRSKANDYADMQAWFFGGLILNHLLSAVDAAWTAHSHNKVLYEEDVSWYHQIHFNGGYSPLNSVSSVNVYWNF